MIKKIIVIIVIVALIVLLIAWGVDYFRYKDSKPPVFCIEQSIYDYANGSVHECIGLGYKVYRYDLETLKTREFVMIWEKMKKK